MLAKNRPASVPRRRRDPYVFVSLIYSGAGVAKRSDHEISLDRSRRRFYPRLARPSRVLAKIAADSNYSARIRGYLESRVSNRKEFVTGKMLGALGANVDAFLLARSRERSRDPPCATTR